MKFVITVPCIEMKSAGVRSLFHLTAMLNSAGFHAEVNGYFETENDIMVYPDVVRGNPHGAKKVVRYMLYYPTAYFGGDRIPATDCVIVYRDAFFPEVAAHYDGQITRANIITMPVIEPGLFYPEEKTVEEVLYVGKPITPHRPSREMPVITRGNMSRAECAALLRKTRNLYSTDHHSVILEEAALCGCIPWMVDGPDTFHQARFNNLESQVQNTDRDRIAARRFADIAIDFFYRRT